MLGTGVPEAAVNEDDDAGTYEDEVGAAGDSRCKKPMVDPETKSHSVKK